MEVDRIWRIDGLDSKAQPAWQKSAQRRRKFAEEIEPLAEDEPEEESSAQDDSADELRHDYSESPSAHAANSPSAPDVLETSFRAIA
jgi:hypothetical protein